MPTAIDLVVREADPAQWDCIISQLPAHTVFHTRAWLETIAATTPGARIMLAVAELEGRPGAAWPALEFRKGPFRIIGSPLPGWSTAYMGPLFAEDCDVQGALQVFLSHRLFRRYAYFACRTMNDGGGGGRRPIDLGAFGFNAIDQFETYLIDLTQSEETLWENLKSECRTRIRKAQKLNIEVRREEDEAGGFIDDFWAMSQETFAKSKIQPTHTREFCEELYRRLSGVRCQVSGVSEGGPSTDVADDTDERHNLSATSAPSVDASCRDRAPDTCHLAPLTSPGLHVISAFVDGKTGGRAATLMLPFDDHTMYYWGGASFQEYRELPVNNLLHWQAIRDGRAMGLRHYDMVSTRGGPGRFKKTFGPEAKVVATHWERSPSKLMAVLKRGYEGYLRKRRRVD